MLVSSCQVKNCKSAFSDYESQHVIGLSQCLVILRVKWQGGRIKTAKSKGLWPLSMPNEIESGIKRVIEPIENLSLCIGAA